MRQKPTGAPVDEVAPPPQTARLLRLTRPVTQQGSATVAQPVSTPAQQPEVSPATEPLPTEPAAAAVKASDSGAIDGAAGGSGAGAASQDPGRMQYPHYSGHTSSPDGFETLPAAPLPDATEQPSRPASDPDTVEPLPTMDSAGT